ncbi:hypothetical protein [Salidesulfovibrio onnuriiensis]|uniref:hypothetical protein n=1 Tax=Salidesulfovibrio onnuriiensis TaxID=2583823 RepID=UPI0011CAE436|nr:hypothetical protein [Salidesulfovibrio onnuriiensis]
MSGAAGWWRNWGRDPGRLWNSGGRSSLNSEDRTLRNQTPTVVPVRGGFRMYYASTLSHDLFAGGIRSAFSKNGVTWQEEEGYRLSSSETNRVLCPSTVALPDGRLRMFYEVQRKGQGSFIAAAISRDGLEWAPERMHCLEADKAALGSPCIVPLQRGYRLYYHHYEAGPPENGLRNIRSAFSLGGLEFISEPGIRVVQEAADEAYAVYAPEVIHAGNAWRMYYAAWPSEGSGLIKTAVSMDGLAWEKQGVVLAPDDGDGVKVVSEPSLLALPDGRMLMHYEACDVSGNWSIRSVASRS